MLLNALRLIVAAFFLASFVLRLLDSISTPTTTAFYYLSAVTPADGRYGLTGGDGISLKCGNWGCCVQSAAAGQSCTGTSITWYDDPLFKEYAKTLVDIGSTQRALVKALVLTPIGCGLAFFATLAALVPSGWVSLPIASLATLAIILNLSLSHPLFVLLRNHINDAYSGFPATSHVAGTWFTVAATATAVVGWLVLAISTCIKRREQRRPMDALVNDDWKAAPGAYDGHDY